MVDVTASAAVAHRPTGQVIASAVVATGTTTGTTTALTLVVTASQVLFVFDGTQAGAYDFGPQVTMVTPFTVRLGASPESMATFRNLVVSALP